MVIKNRLTETIFAVLGITIFPQLICEPSEKDIGLDANDSANDAALDISNA